MTSASSGMRQAETTNQEPERSEPTRPRSQWPSEMSRLSGWSRRVGDRWRPLILILLLLVGVGTYLRVWLSDRGLWNDELCIAINLRDLSTWDLTGALKCKQIAPPAWLAWEQVFYQLLGPDERALRLPSMIAMVVALLVTAYVAGRVVGRWGAVLTIALMVSSPLLVTYAGELKQYATETAIAVLILWAADAYAADDRADRNRVRRAIGWLVVGLLATVLSYSSLIVLVGCTAGIPLYLAVRRRFADLLVFVVATVPVGVLSYAVVTRRLELPQLANQNSFFDTGLPPTGATGADLVAWLPRMWAGFVQSPLEWQAPALVLLVILGGVTALLARRRLLWATMLAAVIGAAVCAAALNGFPFEDRVALYLVPLVMILVAAAVDGAFRATVHGFAALGRPVDASRWWSARRTSTVAVSLLAAIATVAVTVAAGTSASTAATNTYRNVEIPRYRDPGRDVLRDVAGKLRAGDKVVVYNFSRPLATWYGKQLRLPITHLVNLKAQPTCSAEPVKRLFADGHRVWYVHGARLSTDPPDFTARVTAALSTRARVVDQLVTPGSRQKATSSWAPGWVLFDPKTAPAAKPAPAKPADNRTCLTLARYQDV